MRIRSRFLLGFVAIALPGLLLSGWFAISAWRDASRASRAIQMTQLFSDLGRAQASFAVQAGGLSIAVRSPAPDMASLQRTQEAALQRLAAMERSARAVGMDLPQAREAAALLEEAMRRLAAVVHLPPDQRNPGPLLELLGQRTPLVTGIGASALTAAREVMALAPEASSLVELALQAMVLRDVSGPRALMIAGWLNGAPVTADGVASATEIGGRMVGQVAAMERLAETVRTPRVMEALGRLRRDITGEAEPYWRSFVAVARARLTPDGASRPWPQAINAYHEFNVRVAPQLLDMRDAALDDVLERVSDRHAEAEQHVWMSAAAMLATGVLVVFALATLLRGLVTPLGLLTGTVRRIGAGELTLAVPARDRPDELGEMARAVDQLRLASLEREALEAAQKAEAAAQLDRAQRVDLLLRQFEAETADVLRGVASAAA